VESSLVGSANANRAHLLRMASTKSLGMAPLTCTTPLSSNSRRSSSSVAVAGRGFSHPSDSGEMDPVLPSSLSSDSFHSGMGACQRGAAKYEYCTSTVGVYNS
jgi:hypothetical protein